MAEREKLSRLDRYFLTNQLRILEALYPDDASDLAIQRESLERGYEMLYAWDMEHIYDGDSKMTVEESKEVWDTMDMFYAIDRAIEKYGPENFKDYSFTKFVGYDGNNESKFMAFAAFTVERLHRFEYVPMIKKGYWNSHMPVREVYQRMLDVWLRYPVAHRHELSSEQLTDVLKAAIHPDRR